MILCLGMSYVDVNGQMSDVDSEVSGGIVTADLLKVAVDCVERGILTEMDGRDLAHCVATEKECQVDVYSVSQEKAALYRAD